MHLYDEKKVDETEAARKKWEQTTLSKYTKKAPERKKEFLSSSNIPVKRLYTLSDVGSTDYIHELGFPGEFPATRGVYPTMYRGRFWTMRQYAGFGSAEETNQRFKYLLKEGQTGLSVAFDLPTQIGYDSDHELSYGEVGKVGVSINSIEDMETLFNGIPLSKVSTSMTINSSAPVILALYIVTAEKQGADESVLQGTVQNDVLKEYIARGTYIFPPKPSMRLAIDIVDYCFKHVPKWNTISISGYHIREAGATAVQEVAFTLADGIAYVDAATSRGLKVDTFAPRLSFFFASHMDLLEEVAKFRAARRLWAKIMKERFKAQNPESMMLRFHTQTGGVTLTAQQPENNIVRVTLQALASVLGGTQSLHTNSMDEALALPSEKAVRIALRTQQIIASEGGVTNTIDPLAGSFYIESLTNEIESQAMDYMKKIDDMGGMIPAIERGYPQKEILSSAYRFQKEVESKGRIIVGVNEYAIEEELSWEVLRVKPEVEERQKKRLKAFKAKRHNEEAKKALEKIRELAQGNENLMPAIIEAVRKCATNGEICDALREVYGEYRAPEII
ncbi:MAG: methylmalonyl-CoA mutase family protein [Promethearchaeati archaeon SRVP18_Atabeyarchaeia-1]